MIICAEDGMPMVLVVIHHDKTGGCLTYREISPDGKIIYLVKEQ